MRINKTHAQKKKKKKTRLPARGRIGSARIIKGAAMNYKLDLLPCACVPLLTNQAAVYVFQNLYYISAERKLSFNTIE